MKNTSLKILFLNRRDIKNPAGGGAEFYTHEAAKALVKKGHAVHILSSRFKGAPLEEIIDHIKYIRKGSELTVHFHGFLHALRSRKNFDLIIDEFNGLGFFTFPFSRSVLLIHQLYKEFWFRELGLPGLFPYMVEPVFLRRYRKRPAITVSESTKEDLRALGFGEARIHIVMNAIKGAPLTSVPVKEGVPTLIFLGRLRATKRPEDAIKIYRRIKEKIPGARLWIVGTGPEEDPLRRLAAGDPGITFFGWQEDEKKLKLLGRAHVLLVPGVREGFGINVIEAASRGTPAIGYDVPGLRDSIKDGLTGFTARGVEDASEKSIRLLEDKGLYSRMAAECLLYAGNFNWERRGEEFVQLIERLSGKH